MTTGRIRMWTLAAVLGTTSAFAAEEPKREKRTINIQLVAERPPRDVSEDVVVPGDRPGHRMAQRIYVYQIESPDSEIDGEATQFGHIDETNGTGTHRGYGRWLLKSGDVVYVRVEGTHERSGEDASATTKFRGTFEFLDGTGAFADVTGTGKYAGTADANGARWTGSVRLTY